MSDYSILWEDEQIIGLDKPAGLATLPDGYDAQAPHLVGALKAVYNEIWVVHRLDRQTSGVMIFARNPEAHRNLNEQFENRQVEKIYHALVVGEPKWREQRVELKLRPNGDRRHRTVVDVRNGKTAVTNLRVVERYRGYALIEAKPETGRTHQIRAHLAAVGFPIAADELYGGGSSLSLEDEQQADEVVMSLEEALQFGQGGLIKRAALHARSLTFTHPGSGERMTLEARYPADFRRALTELKARRGQRGRA